MGPGAASSARRRAPGTCASRGSARRCQSSSRRAVYAVIMPKPMRSPAPSAPSLPSFAERSTAAFLGLAVGDAFGRPLEFLRGATVRKQPVDLRPGTFRWTDDTHMAMYLAEAVLKLDGGAFEAGDDDAFGHAVGERFVAWAADPLTPSTAPGGTCLRGTANYRASRDWRSSGVVDSDGCGAVMRIAPLPMAFSGAALTRAADISARVTHAHPNAREAAVAGAHLLRALLVGGELDEAWVRGALRGLAGPWGFGGTVAKSLEAALEVARRPGLTELDEAAIHPGDGGWRSGSALGLAVAAALAWGHDPRVAIERAARIDGDSDSVACLVGMFLGAAKGLSALPADMVAAVPERERLEALAAALVQRRERLDGPAPKGALTSASSPLRVAWAHALEGGGRIGVTFAPGKRDPRSMTGPWHRDLEADLDRLVHVERVDRLVSLVEDRELEHLQIKGLVAAAAARGLRLERYPIVDVSVPRDRAGALAVVEGAAEEARAGASVVFHCRGGLGRAGLMAAAALVRLGVPPRTAIEQVRRVRPGAIETSEQERFVMSIADDATPRRG